jgi:hypothetical protein
MEAGDDYAAAVEAMGTLHSEIVLPIVTGEDGGGDETISPSGCIQVWVVALCTVVVSSM